MVLFSYNEDVYGKRKYFNSAGFFLSLSLSLVNAPVLVLVLLFASSFLSPNLVFASDTNGTIDSTYKYAWGENIGWINFGCDNCDVSVTDAGLSGYALSETVGWINLGDVVNDGEGNLSGYAWGENIGWIIFGGDYKVKTDWRPQNARPACNNSGDDDGDGKTDYSADPGCSSQDDTDETDPPTITGSGSRGSRSYYPPTQNLTANITD